MADTYILHHNTYWSGDDAALDAKNDPFPEETLKQMQASDSVLLAAIGGIFQYMIAMTHLCGRAAVFAMSAKNCCERDNSAVLSLCMPVSGLVSFLRDLPLFAQLCCGYSFVHWHECAGKRV